MNLNGKVAIVTGAGQGIGRAITLRLAKDGADIVVADINLTTAKSVTGEVEAMGRKALATKTDVTRYPECEALVDTAIRQMGKVDILVNNAGGGPRELRSDFMAQSEELWDMIIKRNLYATRNCCRAVINHMLGRKTGKIVNVASNAALNGVRRMSEYSVAKAGIIALTRCLAAEVGHLGINVNCIAPGTTRTAATGFYHKDETSPTRILQRIAEPEEQASAVAFLVSDDAQFIMGHCLVVDGGLYIPI